MYVTRSGYTGEDGFEVSISNELVEVFTKELLDNGAKLIGLGARDTLRLEAGLCLPRTFEPHGWGLMPFLGMHISYRHCYSLGPAQQFAHRLLAQY